MWRLHFATLPHLHCYSWKSFRTHYGFRGLLPTAQVSRPAAGRAAQSSEVAVLSPPPPPPRTQHTAWMTLLTDSLIVAAQCQAQFVCITGVGAIGAARKILDGPALSLLSRIYLRLLLPCLMLGLSTSFSAERLQEWSPILVVACCHTALGFGLGRLTALAMRLQSPHTELLVLTTAFGNCGSLPFVLVLPVATNWKAMQDHPDALGEGMAIIGLCAPDPTPAHSTDLLVRRPTLRDGSVLSAVPRRRPRRVVRPDVRAGRALPGPRLRACGGAGRHHRDVAIEPAGGRLRGGGGGRGGPGC